MLLSGHPPLSSPLGEENNEGDHKDQEKDAKDDRRNDQSRVRVITREQTVADVTNAISNFLRARCSTQVPVGARVATLSWERARAISCWVGVATLITG